MKASCISVTILLAIGFMQSANAQKAYNNINYKANINANPAMLTLADGYLLASKITISFKHGSQAFAPIANEADDKGSLKFIAVKRSGSNYNPKAWFVLKNLEEDNPSSVIKAIYWDGVVKRFIIFKIL